MLWRAMLRGTAAGLLATASADAGVDDTWYVVFARDRKRGCYGGAPEFQTYCELKIEVQAEAAIPDGTPPDEVESVGRSLAQSQLDDLCELAESALLGGQGFSAVIACTQGDTAATPTSTDGMSNGMILRGPGIDPRDPFLAIKTVNGDGTVTLAAPYRGATGSYIFNVGSFVGLFEQIDSVDTYPRNYGLQDDSYIACATINIVGFVHEVFEPVRGADLDGVNLYVDSVNIFDPNGDYDGQEPFAVASAPRTAGPDGRPDIVAVVDTSP